jgi:hypothetical protein
VDKENEAYTLATKHIASETAFYSTLQGVTNRHIFRLATMVGYGGGSETNLFYFTLGTHNCVMKRAALLSLVKAYESGKAHSMASDDYFKVTIGSSFEDELSRRNQSRICLLDPFFGKPQVSEASAAEAFVLLRLTDGVRKQIVNWAGHKATDVSPIERFKAVLTEQLNAPTWLLSEGRVIDPRPLTVFLIEATAACTMTTTTAAAAAAANAAPMSSDERTASLDWIVGLPPIEGREERARSMVADELAHVGGSRQLARCTRC